MTFACSSCQMVQMAWLFPDFFDWLKALLVAALACLVAAFLENRKPGQIVEGVLVLGLSFLVGFGVLPILVFPLLSLALPVILLYRVFSRKRSVKIAALVGLLPLVCVGGYGYWSASRLGPTYRLDANRLPDHISISDGPGLTDDLLIDSLFEGPEVRHQNAAVVLRARSYRVGTDDLRSWREKILSRNGDRLQTEPIQELLGRIDAVLEKESEAGSMTPASTPSPTPGQTPRPGTPTPRL